MARVRRTLEAMGIIKWHRVNNNKWVTICHSSSSSLVRVQGSSWDSIIILAVRAISRRWWSKQQLGVAIYSNNSSKCNNSRWCTILRDRINKCTYIISSNKWWGQHINSNRTGSTTPPPPNSIQWKGSNNTAAWKWVGKYIHLINTKELPPVGEMVAHQITCR